MNTDTKKAFSYLKKNYTSLSGISDAQLMEFLKINQMDMGDNLVVSDSAEASHMVILEGVVECRGRDGVSKLITSMDTFAHPINLSEEDLHLTACDTTSLIRIDLTSVDFLLAWGNMIQIQSQDTTTSNWLINIESPLLFKHLPLENIQKIYEKFVDVDVKSGQEIIRQGDTGDYFYFIEEGVAEVWQKGIYDDEQKLVATLSQGQHFGDDALVSNRPRNATVKMSSDGKLKRLSQHDFNNLINSPMLTRVSNVTARDLLEDGAQLLDVRYEHEYKREYINNAHLIPLDELRDRLDELNKQEKYVVYCHSGERSVVGVYLLQQHGFEAVCMNGGIRGWRYGVETCSQ